MSPSTDPHPSSDLPATIDALMPQLRQDLIDLSLIPSVASDGQAAQENVRKAAEKVRTLLAGAGVAAELMPIGDDGTQHSPLVYADHRPRGVAPDAPTVLLYAHYDVQPAGTWAEAFKPFIDPTTKRLVGRGTADDKSGIMLHLGAIRAFGGAPPVALKIVFEGEEETGRDALEKLVRKRPELFRADVIVIADTGNYQLGKPTLTTSLRGIATLDVTVRTLKAPVHNGMYGGPAPDAFTALVRMLATLHDTDGNVAPGLLEEAAWQGVDRPDEKQFRQDAGVLPGVALTGTGSIAQRLYTKPAINVIGMDGMPRVAAAGNALHDAVTARLSIRLTPSQDPSTALDKLRDHLRKVRPWNVQLTLAAGTSMGGYQADTGKPHYAEARQALSAAYGGQQPQCAGQGGSIPLVAALQQANPQAAVLMWGCEEPLALIHAPGESLDLGELRNMTLAEATLLASLGAASRTAVGAAR